MWRAGGGVVGGDGWGGEVGVGWSEGSKTLGRTTWLFIPKETRATVINNTLMGPQLPSAGRRNPMLR